VAPIPSAVEGRHRRSACRGDPRVERFREEAGVELTVGEVLDSPHTFIGSMEYLKRKVVDLRERFVISSFLIDDVDALAPVVEELAGR
jgi:hypothetical protein